jgi:methylated-DNA-[protein]-cysteine S-methyltransferase
MRIAHHIKQRHILTPLGSLTIARSQDGLSGLWFEAQKYHPPALEAEVDAADPLLAEAARQLHAYFRGALRQFDLPLAPLGTPFQQAVWNGLLKIPLGETVSYGQLADRLDARKAIRAVGAAVGRNPVSVIVPCHRVLGSDGSLTGYAGGLPRKSALLRLEGVAHPTQIPLHETF